MKALIAGACLTIMAGGAYYGIGEYQAHDKARIQRLLDNQDADIKKLSDAYGVQR